MKLKYRKRLLSGVALLLIATTAHSAPWDKSQRLTRMSTSYDTTKVETITGVIEKIYEKTPSSSANADSLGYHMTVKTAHEVIDVHLGPVWYLNRLDGKLDKGDLVQVVGSWTEAHAHQGGSPGKRNWGPPR